MLITRVKRCDSVCSRVPIFDTIFYNFLKSHNNKLVKSPLFVP